MADNGAEGYEESPLLVCGVRVRPGVHVKLQICRHSFGDNTLMEYVLIALFVVLVLANIVLHLGTAFERRVTEASTQVSGGAWASGSRWSRS